MTKINYLAFNQFILVEKQQPLTHNNTLESYQNCSNLLILNLSPTPPPTQMLCTRCSNNVITFAPEDFK